MAMRISLGKCTDQNIYKILDMCKKGIVKKGDKVVRDGKSYFVTSEIAYTIDKKPILGTVDKTYRRLPNGEWHLQRRSVSNERGYYERIAAQYETGFVDDRVYIAKGVFKRLPDGSYFQAKFDHSPERIVSSEEMEAAIDYVKGKGSVENYNKLLR